MDLSLTTQCFCLLCQQSRRLRSQALSTLHPASLWERSRSFISPLLPNSSSLFLTPLSETPSPSCVCEVTMEPMTS